jgi:hypothetical protein
MAYQDLSKIGKGAYYVFIAARSNPSTPATLPLQAVITAGGDSTWKPIGAYKLGDAKAKSTVNTIDIYDGTKYQIGAELKVDMSSLETDATKLGVLEAFINSKCDILAVKNDGTFAYIEYKGVIVTVDIDDKLSLKDPDAIVLTCHVIGAKASDFKAQGTIAAA